jgi:hypothetical protein
MRQIDNTCYREHFLWSKPRNFVHHTTAILLGPGPCPRIVSRVRIATFGFREHGPRLLFGRGGGGALFVLGLCFVLGARLHSQELVEGERVQVSAWTAALTVSALWGITRIYKDFFFGIFFAHVCF